MRSTTFKVAEVSISKDRLPDVTPKEAIESQTNRATEACSSYHGRLLETPGIHPLFAAAHLAFARHRPLVLLTRARFSKANRFNAEARRGDAEDRGGVLGASLRAVSAPSMRRQPLSSSPKDFS